MAAHTPIKKHSRVTVSDGALNRLNRFALGRRRVSVKDKAYFYELFAVMIEAGIPLLKALSILAEKTTNLRLREVVLMILNFIEEGDNLSSAMAKFPLIFSEVEVGIIQSGELTGSLNTVMLRLAEDMNKRLELTMKIRQALTYPVTIIAVLLLSVFVILGVVIPPLKNLFESLNSEIPEGLSFLIDTSLFLQQNAALVVIFLLLLISFVVTYVRTDRGRSQWDRIKLGTPYLSDLVKKIVLIRFVRSLSILLDSGLPLVKTLKITAVAVGNEVYRRAVEQILMGVQQGQRISEAMEELPHLFPPDLTQIVAVGETTATISTSTQKIAAQYEREIDHSLKNLTNIVEPIAILGVGLVVGWFAFVVLGSIFSITEQLG